MPFRLAPFSKRSVFKCLHSGQRFQMYAFSMKTLSVVMWTIGENASKSMRFQTKTYQCRTGPYSKIQYHFPNIKQLSTIETTEELMNFPNYFVNMQVMKFISSCFDLRDKLLSIHRTKMAAVHFTTIPCKLTQPIGT